VQWKVADLVGIPTSGKGKKGGKMVDPGAAYMNQVGRPIGKQDKESLNTGRATF
jgi:hypothetical protein